MSDEWQSLWDKYIRERDEKERLLEENARLKIAALDAADLVGNLPQCHKNHCEEPATQDHGYEDLCDKHAKDCASENLTDYPQSTPLRRLIAALNDLKETK